MINRMQITKEKKKEISAAIYKSTPHNTPEDAYVCKTSMRTSVSSDMPV
jgi:hypothetical protein